MAALVAMPVSVTEMLVVVVVLLGTQPMELTESTATVRKAMAVLGEQQAVVLVVVAQVPMVLLVQILMPLMVLVVVAPAHS
jgi:hypothetical protein